ncbi:hypothetical protein [Bradyrhizobium elkanii]|jgi:hypothetical protein|uniref:Uncharacterized protein n=1 Tax=Bradyrhizobium elkanii TaxID=29448 RepID=A0ABV4F3J3_BRAEL|nr:hypothetical protein [Bradyrhizobium elkanii]MCS3881102.1 hypothetical protein [Bradyrhizobium elkanii]MCS4219840.1 hypothetical protein [Bradyrhizobium elkanii]WLB13748.1 hypothetical protein QIH87_23145 [Bradyrhizobium elkanii]
MKRTKKQQALDDARIQRAVTGMIIPMMSIPALHRHAEDLIAKGVDDTALAAGVRKFMGASCD